MLELQQPFRRDLIDTSSKDMRELTLLAFTTRVSLTKLCHHSARAVGTVDDGRRQSATRRNSHGGGRSGKGEGISHRLCTRFVSRSGPSVVSVNRIVALSKRICHCRRLPRKRRRHVPPECRRPFGTPRLLNQEIKIDRYYSCVWSEL